MMKSFSLRNDLFELEDFNTMLLGYAWKRGFSGYIENKKEAMETEMNIDSRQIRDYFVYFPSL